MKNIGEVIKHGELVKSSKQHQNKSSQSNYPQSSTNTAQLNLDGTSEQFNQQHRTSGGTGTKMITPQKQRRKTGSKLGRHGVSALMSINECRSLYGKSRALLPLSVKDTISDATLDQKGGSYNYNQYVCSKEDIPHIGDRLAILNSILYVDDSLESDAAIAGHLTQMFLVFSDFGMKQEDIQVRLNVYIKQLIDLPIWAIEGATDKLMKKVPEKKDRVDKSQPIIGQIRAEAYKLMADILYERRALSDMIKNATPLHLNG